MGDSTDTNIYFVENGSLRIFITDGQEERIIRFGYQNNIIVALDSFFNTKTIGFLYTGNQKNHSQGYF